MPNTNVLLLQAQLVVLASQIAWSGSVDAALTQIEQKGGNDLAALENVLQVVESTLNVLADSVLHEQPPVRRRKLEHLVSVTKVKECLRIQHVGNLYDHGWSVMLN